MCKWLNCGPLTNPIFCVVTDSRTGTIFCEACGDFVYDSNLERFLMEPTGLFSNGKGSKLIFSES